MQDNLIFEKIYQDDNLIELKISAFSEYVSAYQNCYIQDTALLYIAKKICNYTHHYEESYYLEFGHKEGDYTPAFSMELLPADSFGHVKIEVDLEINDNDTRAHHCPFYVNSELGLVEQFGKSLERLVHEPVGGKVSLQLDNEKINQEILWSELRKIQENTVNIALAKLEKYDNTESLLYDVTYETIYAIMELLDGHKNKELRGEIINISTGEKLNFNDELHNHCEEYLNCSEI